MKVIFKYNFKYYQLIAEHNELENKKITNFQNKHFTTDDDLSAIVISRAGMGNDGNKLELNLKS